MSTKPVAQRLKAKRAGLHSELNREARDMEEQAREVLLELDMYLAAVRAHDVVLVDVE